MLLKQSTAVVISFGPFLDKTDGVTLETGLVSALDHGTTGIMLSKNGGTLAVRHASVTASTYDAHGCYKVTLDTTDTGTLGSLRVVYTDAATCLPVWYDFHVVPANIYDALVLGSDLLDVSAAQIAGAAVDATAAQLGVNIVNWKGSAAAAMTGDAFARLGAPAGASVSVDVAAVKTETAAIKVKTDNLPSDPADASDIAASFGTVNSTLSTIAGYIDTEVAAIKAKTDSLPSDPADASDIAAAFSTVNSTLATIAAYIDTEVAAIKAKTDNLPSDPADASDIAASFSSLASTLSTIAGYIDTEVAAIKAKTDNLPASPAATGDIPTAAQNADKLLGRNLAGGSDGGRTVTSALRTLRNKVTISGGTITVYAEDDTTIAYTGTVTTDAAADPITGVDPA